MNKSADFAEITSLAFSPHFIPDDVLFASGTSRGAISVWKASNGFFDLTKQVFSRPEAHKDSVESLTFSPNGRFLASAGDTVKIWQTATWTCKASLPVPAQIVVFHPKEQKLAAASSKGLILWDFRSMKVRTLESGEISFPALSFSADGETLVSATHEDCFHSAMGREDWKAS